MRIIFTICIAIFLSSALHATGLKKVLVLDFINIEQKTEYKYLEKSITETVKKDLKAKFAFRETEKRDWQKVAEKNYIFRSDYYTRTAAMSLGLLANQDVVIAGGFRVFNKQEVAIIKVDILIIDIAKKKVLTSVF